MPLPPAQDRSARPGRRLALALVVAIAAGVLAVFTGAIEVPERHDPWAPLDVRAAPNWLTAVAPTG